MFRDFDTHYQILRERHAELLREAELARLASRAGATSSPVRTGLASFLRKLADRLDPSTQRPSEHVFPARGTFSLN